MNLIQDDKGNYSSLRVMLIFVCLFIVFLYVDYRQIMFIEVAKPEPDYEGLVKLFLAMMVTFGMGWMAKLIQKKIEK